MGKNNKRRRIKRKGYSKKSGINKRGVLKSLNCSKCGAIVNNVGYDTVSVICPNCSLIDDIKKFGVPKIALQSINKKNDEDKKPRGWHFMKVFVDKDGNVFHKGVEQPKLKGTLPPTKIKKKSKKNKKNKWEEHKIKSELLKEIKIIEKKIKDKHKQGKKTTKTLEKKLTRKRKKLNKIL